MNPWLLGIALTALVLAASFVAIWYLTSLPPIRERATYRVEQAEGDRLCVVYVRGSDEPGRSCRRYPRIDTDRPIVPGDCVVLTWYAEGSNTSRLHLVASTRCD